MLADVLTIEWGLAELKLEGGMIEDEAALKSILHALLISGTLGMLSLAGSRKVKSGGWRLLAIFLRRVSFFHLLRGKCADKGPGERELLGGSRGKRLLCGIGVCGEGGRLPRTGIRTYGLGNRLDAVEGIAMSRHRA